MNTCLDILIVLGYWISGFLSGYGIRGLILIRQKDKIVTTIISELKENKIIQ